jgi:hypothetical protein
LFPCSSVSLFFPEFLHFRKFVFGVHRTKQCSTKSLGAAGRPLPTRLARWFIFLPKITIWVNFGWSYIGRCWYILVYLRPFRIFVAILVYFMVIWYIFPVLVCCTKKNLATLLPTIIIRDCFPFFSTNIVDWNPLTRLLGPIDWTRKNRFKKLKKLNTTNQSKKMSVARSGDIEIIHLEVK